MPLANEFLSRPEEKEDRFDLDVAFCPVCSLVQITEQIPPERLFRKYFYFSSISSGMVAHAKELADSLIESRGLGPDSFVIEVASNDGYLLQNFQQRGIPCLGIDPAVNVAEKAREKGIETITDFFGEKLAEQLPQADVIIALNVLGHVPDPQDFMRGVRRVLKPGGVCVIEVPSARDMVDQTAFDTVYFEHLNYWALNSLFWLCKVSGMTLNRVEKIGIHGGGYRLYIEHIKPSHFDRKSNDLLGIETALGVNTIGYYQCFSNRVKDTTRSLQVLLSGLRHQGKSVVAYGAAAKGTMLLNYVGTHGIKYVVDSTPAKIGKYLAGVHLPVVAPTELGSPDFVLLTAWNWASEIMKQHPGFEGRWILPIPNPRLV
jgi:SAM-dependent methyltransferase